MNDQPITITPTTVPGQLPQQQYGVDAAGNLYTFSPTLGQWMPENLAMKLNREARAAGRTAPCQPSNEWRRGENWMTRQRGRKAA